jgi:hypothetical protein
MRLIHTNIENLLTDLIQTIQQRTNYEGNVVFSNLASTDEPGVTTDDSTWPPRIEFLDFLCYLPNQQDYLQRLITFLTKFYEGNQSQLRKVEDFAANYSPEHAIQWYTKDTFVYRLLNVALRRYNIEVLFLFGFLIRDIQKQLKREHEKFTQERNRDNKPIVKVYRGQMMSPKEIQELKANNGGAWITNNSFFSATFELQSVLFEIEVNTQIKSRLYGNVSQLSQFEQEAEFIFSFGNRFGKTVVFYEDDEHVCTVKLQLNYNYYMKDDKEFIFDRQRKMLKKCVSLLETVIEEISIESINIIFNELITLYPSEEEWISALQMSWLASKSIQEQNYITAILYYNKALSVWHEFIDDEELNCFTDMGHIHQRLARCYQCDIEDQQTLAEKHYLEAIQYFKLAVKKATTHYERMKIYEKLLYLEKHRMKLVGYDPNDIQMVLRYEELGIANMLQHYNNDSVQLGQALVRLAELRKFQLEYDESLANYERALDIFLQQPFVFDFYLIISDIINDMGKIYIEEKNCDYLSAIKYDSIKYRYILKHVMYVRSAHKKVRCVNQWDLGQSQVELAYKYLAIGERETAMMHLSEALVSYREFDFADIKDYKGIRHSQLQEKLADVSVQSHRYEEAYEYIKVSMTYYQEQIYMLEANIRLGGDDNITCIKRDREWKKMEIRRQMLKNKMINIKKLKENSNMEEKDF